MHMRNFMHVRHFPISQLIYFNKEGEIMQIKIIPPKNPKDFETRLLKILSQKSK